MSRLDLTELRVRWARLDASLRARKDERADRREVARYKRRVPVCNAVGHVWADFLPFSGGGAETCERCGVTHFWRNSRDDMQICGQKVA